jgi:DNA sulfur modification protein DndB
MAFSLGVLKGKLGSTEYYVATMPISEAVSRLSIPRDMPGWSDLSIEERDQRDINYKRVRDQIAPYFASDKDRFIGSLIVAIKSTDQPEFETTIDAGIKMPKAYLASLGNIGILHFSGKEQLYPLDGQHRLAALKFAITGKDEKENELKFDLDPNLHEEQITLILVPYDVLKARKIFNKVNKYAKKTTKAENLIINDDDIIAVISREVVAPLIGERVVNSKGNTLSKSAGEFTTLATIYEATKDYLEAIENDGAKINIEVLPHASREKIWRAAAESFWKSLIENVEKFSEALHDPSENGDEKRAELRETYAPILKPFSQRIVIEVIKRLSEPDDTGSRMDLKDIFAGINSVNWGSDNDAFQGVIMQQAKIMSGGPALRLAARAIAYCLGENLDSTEIGKLESSFKEGTGKTLSEFKSNLF